MWGAAFTVAFITFVVGIPAFTMGFIAGQWQPPDDDGKAA